MASAPLTPSQKRVQRRGMIVSVTASAVLIAIFVTIRPLIPPGVQPIDDNLAILAGAMMLLLGLMQLIVHSVFPQMAPMPGRQRLAQVLSCLIGSVTLLLPIFGARLIEPQLSFAIIIVLNVISFWMFWVIWRESDELMRDLMKESWVAAHFVVVTALVIYAVGERLGLLSGVTVWGALGFAYLVNLVSSIWATYRRGLDRPPSDE